MNQQKNYQKHRKTRCFLEKELSLLIILILFFSIVSNIIVPITTAAPLALNPDDSKTQTTAVETKDTDTKTTTPSTDTKNEPTVEPTQTTSSPTTSKDDSQTSTSPTSTSDKTYTNTEPTATTSSTKTTDETNSTEKITTDQQNTTDILSTNKDNSSDSSSTQINKSYYEITLVDKTKENQNNDITFKSNDTTTKSTYNLYQEGEIGDISKDDQVTVKTSTKEENKSIITEINFTASTNQEKVRLTLSEYNEEPEEVTNNLSVSPSKKIYKYIDIKLTANETYIGEIGIETMTFTFTVEKEWIESNNLDKDTIVMMRYHNDSWGNLNTTFVNETNELLYFKAETPGLSVFAVVGDTVVEDSDAIIDETTQIPIWLSFGVIASSCALLGIVLVKKRFIYRR